MNEDLLQDLKGFLDDATEANLTMRPDDTHTALVSADAVLEQLIRETEG